MLGWFLSHRTDSTRKARNRYISPPQTLLFLEELEKREMLAANAVESAAASLLGAAAQFRNDVATSNIVLVNAVQPSQANTPAQALTAEWNKLAGDWGQVRQAFVQFEYAVLGTYQQALTLLLADVFGPPPGQAASPPAPSSGATSGSGQSGKDGSSNSGGGEVAHPLTGGGLSWMNGSNAPGQPPGWNQDLDGVLATTQPSNKSNNEGDTVSVQIQASISSDNDNDTDSLNYAALDLPSGLSINASTGLISGTVANGAAAEFGGTYNPLIIVSDSEGNSDTTGFTWTINAAQVAPVFTAPTNQTNLRGDNVSLQVNASQVDGDAVSYYAGNLPPGLSIDSNSGLISGTVDGSSTLGTPYAVTVTTVDNVTNLSSSQTFNWTISPTNVAPVLTSPGNQTNSAGDQVALQLAATDADGDNRTYTATGLPPGLTLDPIAGTITGTLPNSAASTTPYNVIATASDGMATSSQSFTWTVHAVSLQNPGDQSNLDGDSVSLQLTVSDANNATLSYSATGLPSGLSINSSSGLISGTIGSSAHTGSPYAVTVTATDSNHDSVSQSFNWNVARVAINNPGTQETQEHSSVSLQLSATDHEATPTYSATGLPSGLSISSSGLISGTIGIGSFGSSPYQVTVTATDGSNTSSQPFVWTVTPRVALVNPGPHSNAVGDTVSLQLSATSPGGTMSYSASGLPAGLSVNSSTGLIFGSPATAGSTPSNVTVTANDGTSSSSQTFAWTVSTINLVAPASQTNNDGDTVALSLTSSYHGSGHLSFGATGLPSGLSINSSTGQITGTIAATADTASPYSVTVTTTANSNSSSQTFNWTVNPVVSIAPITNQSDAVGDSVSMQVSASDVNNKTLTYSATGLPSGLSINSTTGLITGSIAVGDDAHSPYAVTVTATDSVGLSASQSFNWSIVHVSLVNPGSLQSVDSANVSLQMQGGDADGDHVTYTATGLPPGLSINSSGLISGTIASNADTNSPYVATVTASDGTHATSQTFVWVVSQVILIAPSAQTNTEGDTVSLQLQGTKSSGTLSYSASGLPSDLSLNATTGLISGTIAAGDAANGPYTVDVSAGNGTDSTSQTFTWTVNPVVNLTAPANQSNVEGNNVSLQVTATDSKHSTLTYTASGLPSGLSINSSSGLISGTVSTGDAANSPYVVLVTASDGTYSSGAVFAWTVTHTDNTALTMTNPGTQVNVSDDSVNLQINASDPDGIDTLTYSATGLPDGLAINPYNGLISGTVADDAVTATPYSVTVTASDGDGQSVSRTLTMILNAPAISATAVPISAVEGNDTGSITVANFTTPDLNAQAGDFTVTINWGDGSTIDYGAVSGSNGSFTVTGDHTYMETGTYTATITITDSVTGASTAVTDTATVSDAPLTLTGGFQIGQPNDDVGPVPYVVATLTDGNPYAQATDFTVTINGTSIPTNDVESEGDGRFLILDSRGYNDPFPNTQPQTNTLNIAATDDDGASASTSSTVIAGNISSDVPGTMNNWVYTDSNPHATASDFQVTVQWGDGTTGYGSVTKVNNLFFITAALNPDYAQDSYDQSNGTYKITVTVTSTNGDGNLTGTQYVSVVRPPLQLDTDNVSTPANSLSLTNAALASFTVPNTYDGTSEFSATINWGDQSSSSGTVVSEGGGIFEILGSHTYASAGVYPVSVEVSEEWSTGVIPVTEGFLDVEAGALPILGPTVVPGKSIYTYFVPLVGQLLSPNNPWEITTTVGPAPTVLLWGKTTAPFNGVMKPALFADVQFSNSNAQVAKITVEETRNKLLIVYRTNVNVVRVIVSAGSANKNTVLNPRINTRYGNSLFRVTQPPNITYVLRNYYGDNVNAFQFTGETMGTESSVQLSSGNAQNPSLQTTVPVAVQAPPNTDPDIVNDIEVGLVQTAKIGGFAFYSNIINPSQPLIRQLYIGGKTASDITILDWYLYPALGPRPAANRTYDKNSPFSPPNNPNTYWPWYNRSSRVAPLEENYFYQLAMIDAPGPILPLYFNNTQQLPLILGVSSMSFNTYIAARTFQQTPQFLPMAMFGLLPGGLSNKLYYSEAFTNWQLLFSALGRGGLVAANVQGSVSAWQYQQGPYLPDVNVIPAIVGAYAPFGTWE